MNFKSPTKLSVYLCEHIRSIEYAVKKQSPTPSLMQRAGLAAAKLVFEHFPGRGPVLVFAGAGDNGGDAFEMAAHLCQHGYSVSIYQLGEEANYSSDAFASLQKSKAHAIHWVSEQNDLAQTLNGAALIVDGIFGIGLNRPITGHASEIISLINQISEEKSVPVLALDIPSGLIADTGQVFPSVTQTNRPIGAIRASHTITFIANKPGLFMGKGKDLAGKVILDTLDIDSDVFPTASITLNTEANTQTLMPRRQHDSNKGSYGSVNIVGGSEGMCGAPILSARAALFAGAGKVHIGFCYDGQQSPLLFDSLHPEIMCHHVSQIDFNSGVVAIGPGLGQSDHARKIVQQALTHSPQLIIDADAINLIANDTELQQLLAARSSRNFSSILTPHPLEAARLLQTSTEQIQADRLFSAAKLTERYQAVFVLKGSGSVICDGKQSFINISGNPALATGGTGDVLTGLCAALLAQGLNPFDAARLACFVHGAAADDLVAQGIGPIGLVASELPAAIRQRLNH